MIRNITNAASYADTLLPNSSIAQGAMFVIKGESIGPIAYDVASAFPLTTSRAGTSVKVTSTGSSTRYDAFIYYTGPAQVAAILPSAVPEGPATIRVTYNNEESQNFSVTVVKSQFGVFTVNQSGGGEAIAIRDNNQTQLSPVNPARPGETVVFWGTGLGPVNADEGNRAPQFDMTTVPVQAWIGGKPADILFRGRNACCTAVDTIYVRVPQGISGCATPVTFKVGDTYSNTTLIPTTLSGNLCTPSTPAMNNSELSQLVNKTQVWVGNLTLDRSSLYPRDTVQPVGALADQGFGEFARWDVAAGWLGYTGWDMIAPRSCLVVNTGGFVSGVKPPPIITGDAITIMGPSGFGQITQNQVTRLYYGVLGPAAGYIAPGAFNITTGFFNNASASVTLNYATPLTWTNSGPSATITRSAGATINWTGGDPSGFVRIKAEGTVVDRIGGAAQLAVTVTCIAPTADGTFTIPAYVLSALPATQAGNPAVLTVSGMHSIKKMTGGGLDIAPAFIYDHTAIDVTFR